MKGTQWNMFANRAAPVCFGLSILCTLYCAVAAYNGINPPYWDLPWFGTAFLLAAASSLLAVPLLQGAPKMPRALFWIAIPLALFWGIALLFALGLIAGAGAGAGFPG